MTEKGENFPIKLIIRLQEILAATGSTIPNDGKDLLNGFQVVRPDDNTLQKCGSQYHAIPCLITENVKEIDKPSFLQKILLPQLTD